MKMPSSDEMAMRFSFGEIIVSYMIPLPLRAKAPGGTGPGPVGAWLGAAAIGCDLLPFEYCPPRRPGINPEKLADPFERTLRFLLRSKPSCCLLLNADALLEEAVAGQILNSPLENGQPQLDFGRRLSGRFKQIGDDHGT